MKVFIVRHGQSQDSADKVHQRFDSPLTEKGLVQAKQVAERLKNLEIDLIFTSPLTRACQTAEVISKLIDKAFEVEPLLTEEKRPTEIEGVNRDDPKVVLIRNTIKQNYHDPRFKYSDEDTFADMKARGIKLKEKLLTIGDKNILLVSHGIIAKTLLGVIILGETLESRSFEKLSDVFELTKTGLCVLEYTPEKGWRVITWTDQSHLGDN